MAQIIGTRWQLILMASALCCLLGCASTGQTTTNQVTKAEAVSIASQLHRDMSDKAAVQFLNEHGIVMDQPPGGDPIGSSLAFSLSGGGTLVLYFHSDPVGREEKWIVKGLAAASICNWNEEVVNKIRLKDAR